MSCSGEAATLMMEGLVMDVMNISMWEHCCILRILFWFIWVYLWCSVRRFIFWPSPFCKRHRLLLLIRRCQRWLWNYYFFNLLLLRFACILMLCLLSAIIRPLALLGFASFGPCTGTFYFNKGKIVAIIVRLRASLVCAIKIIAIRFVVKKISYKIKQFGAFGKIFVKSNVCTISFWVFGKFFVKVLWAVYND